MLVYKDWSGSQGTGPESNLHPLKQNFEFVQLFINNIRRVRLNFKQSPELLVHVWEQTGSTQVRVLPLNWWQQPNLSQARPEPGVSIVR
jgi:hypothetical protein